MSTLTALPRQGRAKAALVVAITATLVAASTPGASAATWTLQDPNDPGFAYGDITEVVVRATPTSVHVEMAFEGEVPYESIWSFDVDKSDPGPEFAATYNDDMGTPTIFVKRTERWGEAGIDESRCRPRTVHIVDGGHRVTADFPLRCLGTRGHKPRRLRVNAYTSDDYSYVDFAPGERKFGRWFKVG